MFVLRTTVNRSTGFTPAMMCLGRELRGPRDSQWTEQDHRTNFEQEPKDFVKQKRNTMQNCIAFGRENKRLMGYINKAYYDYGRRLVDYRIGDLVLLVSHTISSVENEISASLAARRYGPWEIGRRVSENTYMLYYPGTQVEYKRATVDQLTLYHRRDGRFNEFGDIDPIPFLEPEETPYERQDRIRSQIKDACAKRGRKKGSKNKVGGLSHDEPHPDDLGHGPASRTRSRT
jgi:hypothetical protein